jgi:hypothetical protein
VKKPKKSGGETYPKAGHDRHSLAKTQVYGKFVIISTEGDKPKGISISSAIPSIPINVKATAVTTGTVAHPRSWTRVIGKAKR